MRIRKGDTVQVLSGKHRGKRGQVMVAIPAQNKVIVDGANMAKRHTKPRGATMQGGIIDKDMPLPVSRRGHRVPGVRAHPYRHAYRRDRPQGPDLSEVRDGAVMTTTATRSVPVSRSATTETVRAELKSTWGWPTSWRFRASRRSSSTWGWAGPPSSPRSSRGRYATWR